ncbi:MAG: glycosyltransferase family 2 protein [Rhodothalassiaceae bacterium]
MLISVIIPCHNAEAFLAQTVGSVLDQTRPADELIIIDDGSSDASATLADRLAAAAGDPVRVFRQSQSGAAATRRAGADLARGDALMFLDADDVLLPDTLDALAARLAEAPNSLAACPWSRLDLRPPQWIAQPASCARRRAGQDALAAWLTGWYYPPCALLWSRSAYDRSGGWDPQTSVNDDGDLVMRALIAGVKLAETDRGMSFYRRVPAQTGSLSGQRLSAKGIESRLIILDKILAWLDERGRLSRYRAELHWAASLVAEDGAADHPDLAQRAWDVIARLRTRVPGPVRPRGAPQPHAWPRAHGVITHGQARAEKLLAGDVAAIPSAALPRTPAVSVIIPTYDRPQALARAIDSVLGQSFADFELLVIDDGGKAETQALLAHYTDARLAVLRQPGNLGVAAARNRGMRAARGRYLAFLDDDDVWMPDKLARQVALLDQASEQVGLVYTGAENALAGGRTSRFHPTEEGALYSRMLVCNLLHGAPSSALMRRDLVARVGFFDEDLPAIEDYDFWLRLCRVSEIACLPEPLIRYTDGADGPIEPTRRSRNRQANRDARDLFYTKHGAAMRAAGVAHMFLLDSAKRCLVGEKDYRRSRRLVKHALALRPWHGPSLKHLAELNLPLNGMRRRLRPLTGPLAHG